MKVLKNLVFVVLAMTLLVACSNNDDKKTNKDKNDDTVATSTDTNKNEDNETSKADEQSLHLGDTGHFKGSLGDYDITIQSAKIYNHIGEDKPSNEGYVFVVLDTSVKNTGKETIKAGDVVSDAELQDDVKGISGDFSSYVDYAGEIGNTKSFESIGEIKPNDTVNAQLAYEIKESDHYILWFKWHESTSDQKIRWEFDATEASN